MFGRGLLIACVVPVCVLASPITYSGSGGPIPDDDPGETSFTINVPDVGFVTGGLDNVTVRLINLQHTAISDLTVTLTQESVGTSRTLFDRVGLPGDAPTADLDDIYTFSSIKTGNLWGAAIGLPDTSVVPGELASSATYYPTSAGSSAPNDFSAAFAGSAPTGIWRLTFTDAVGGDAGILGSWELILDIQATEIPEPSSALLLLGGACLLAVRRVVA